MTESQKPWESLTPEFLAALRHYDLDGRGRLHEAEKRYEVNAPLYHYTDRRGLEGIIRDQQIWFTHYQQLNDPSEVTFGMEIAKRILDEVGAKLGPKVKIFCDWTRDLLSTQNLRGILDIYTASFSPERDDLGQWRAYGDDGRGFALGIAPRVFAIVPTPPDQKPHENVCVAKVVYGDVEGRNNHLPAIEGAAAIVAGVIARRANDMRDKHKGITFFDAMAKQLIATELLLNCLTVKHGAYMHELEVRMFIIGLSKRLAPYISSRRRGAEDVLFIKSDVPIQQDKNLTEVVVGPSSPTDAEDFVCDLLAPFHSDPRSVVRRSTIPYRSG